MTWTNKKKIVEVQNLITKATQDEKPIEQIQMKKNKEATKVVAWCWNRMHMVFV